jgi:hypothetical protein
MQEHLFLEHAVIFSTEKEVVSVVSFGADQFSTNDVVHAKKTEDTWESICITRILAYWLPNSAWADVIYIYMMPRFLEGYQKELKKALVSNKVIISHVFELDQLKEYLSDVVVSNKTSTYYYQRNTD